MVRGLAMAACLVSVVAVAAPAHAVSMSECSAKYKAAQSAGTLKGMKWNDFRKAECGAAATKASKKETSGEPTMANTENAPEPAPTKMTAPRGVTFPKAIDPKFAKETPGKARLHTCLEQYKANKANNTLNGVKWIQKGGGYYSMCNTRLKG
ncbi:MAG: hypothetical protein ACTHJ3_19495 [Pararhizobium sp.]